MRGHGECTVRQRQRKSGGRFWEARASIGGRQVSFYDRTKAGALAKARQARADSERGKHVAQPTITVEAYLASWLAAQTSRQSTRDTYERAIRLHIVPAVGPIRLVQLAPSHVESLLGRLVADGYSETMARHVRSVLANALGAAERDIGLVRNAARLARTPKASTPAFGPERLTLADVAAVLAAVRGERIEPAVLFSVATGLRQGELLGLRYEDVDLAKRILTVRHRVERGSGYRRLSRPKGGRERVLALSGSALHALDLERSLQERDRALAADGWRDLGLVFAGPGGDIQPSTLPGYRLKRCLAAAGLPPVRWHATRRMFAAVLLDEGVPLHRIRDLLGHTHVQVTEHYAYTMTDALERDMSAVDSALASRLGYF